MSEQFSVISSEKILESFVFSVERRLVEGRDEQFSRDVVTHNGAVGIVALDSAGRVGLLKQYRATFDKEIWEIPAGTLDIPDESHLDAAKRELREELGGVSDDWASLGTFMVSPGWTNQIMHLFKASAVQVEAPSPHGPEESAMSVHWFELDEIRALLGREAVLDFSLTMGLVRAFGSEIFG